MRPVLHGDVVAAACALLARPDAERPVLMQRMLSEAAIADLYRKRLGRPHPIWGNGSLMAAARRRVRAAEPFLDDRDYCACLAMVFEALIDWRAERAALTGTRRTGRWGSLDPAPAV